MYNVKRDTFARVVKGISLFIRDWGPFLESSGNFLGVYAWNLLYEGNLRLYWASMCIKQLCYYKVWDLAKALILGCESFSLP